MHHHPHCCIFLGIYLADLVGNVGNSDQQPQERHNVSQKDTSKIINVATHVPIVPIKEQYKENQQQHERIH